MSFASVRNAYDRGSRQLAAQDFRGAVLTFKRGGAQAAGLAEATTNGAAQAELVAIARELLDLADASQ